MVGVHGALVLVTALLGLFFIADPCGGGSDLCLGGVVGLMALGVAVFGAVGLAVWRFGRRAAPLLILDCVLVAVLGPNVVAAATDVSGNVAAFGLTAVALLAVVGATLAGRAVAPHRIEAGLVLAVSAGLAALRDAGGLGVPVVCVVALGLGWALARSVPPPLPVIKAPPEPPPAAS
jgi:hypothetical protein